MVGNQPVGFPVDLLGGLLARRLHQAEDLPRIGIVPIPVVLHAMLFLGFQVLLVGFGHRLGSVVFLTCACESREGDVIG